MTVKSIPDGYHTVTPYLIVRGAAQALEFYQAALGAEVKLRLDMPGGKVGHAEIQIGNSRLMLADEFPEMGAVGPETVGGTPVSLMVYVPDVDQLADQAVAAGMKVVRPIENRFYGDRSGQFVDPFGHVWTLSTHKEDVPDDEVKRRAAAMSQQQQ